MKKNSNKVNAKQDRLDYLDMENYYDDDVIKMPKRSKRKTKTNETTESAFSFNNISIIEQYHSKTDSRNIKIEKIFENIKFLSKKERDEFENKFTVARTTGQNEYLNILHNEKKKIVVVNGPAGTGKTMFATEQGIKYFLLNNFEKIIFTRPSVSVDEDLGYLPGTLEEKMAPWVRPIYDILHNFFSTKQINQLMEEKIIEIAPLGYMRGRTFKKAWIVADEMQNSTIQQMKMLLTRLGDDSKLVVTGDLEQHDQCFQVNGLDDFLRRFNPKRSSSISSIEFDKEDIQREPVVKEVLDIYGYEKNECSSYAHDDTDKYFGKIKKAQTENENVTSDMI